MKNLIVIILWTLVFNAFGQSDFKIILFGDGGRLDHPEGTDCLKLLKQQLSECDTNSAILFLGDNIYFRGMPEQSDQTRELAEKRINLQLDALKDFKGKIIFIPGNHDWDQGGVNGLSNIKHQQTYIENYLNKSDVFYPTNGCPGPIEVELTDNITLIILDTQWWLHPFDKPGIFSSCDAQTNKDVVVQLEDILYRNKSKRVIVAAHHPLYSYGFHYGVTKPIKHIFPLLDLGENLYIPLPILGSMYHIYRRLYGTIQDMHHPVNKNMRAEIEKVLKKYPGTTYVNGHDHSLQYIMKDNVNYITSGSGSRASYSKKKKGSMFAKSEIGFGIISFHEVDTPSLVFHTIKATYEKMKLFVRPKINDEVIESPVQVVDSFGVYAANSGLKTNSFFRKLVMGKGYRDVWATGIKTKNILLDTFKNGLTPIKRGGGLQTKTLRLRNSLKEEFVFRSISKDPMNIIPDFMRGSDIARYIVREGVSGSHPYAFLAVPILAEKVKIPHAHPELVFITDDPKLGQFRNWYANTFAIFEERNPLFVENKKSISSIDLFDKKLYEDNDNIVDAKAFLKARLFDLLIGDWDRHEDQWRWIGNKDKENGKVIFKPFPRDRDQAFYVNEGIIPFIVGLSFIYPRFQGYKMNVRNVVTFMTGANPIDRKLLNLNDKESWIATAKEIQNNLTDADFDEAINKMPPEVVNVRTSEIKDKLISNRNALLRNALTYYAFLVKNVDILGSNKKEAFYVKRKNDSLVEVIMIANSNKNQDTLYNRTFNRNETKSINLYGLGNDDEFYIEGEVNNSIKIRAIGGNGKDYFQDKSKVKGWRKYTDIFDTKKGTKLDLSSESRNLTSKYSSINSYDPNNFKHSFFTPIFSSDFNPDDGWIFKLGFMHKSFSFRKNPAAQYKCFVSKSINTQAYSFGIQAFFDHSFGKNSLEFNAIYNAPTYVENFFGWGNESNLYNGSLENLDYFRVRLSNFKLNALVKNNSNKAVRVAFGPEINLTTVEHSTGRIVSDFNVNGLNQDIFDKKLYGSLYGEIVVDKLLNKNIPISGFYWNLEANLSKGIWATSKDNLRLNSSYTFYFSNKMPANVTLANKFGAGITLGPYDFFQAQRLGGRLNLRGVRQERYSGNGLLYNNTDIRVKLYDIERGLIPFGIGILGFFDIGRVYLTDEKSKKWHSAYGAGIWFSPLNTFVFTLTYQKSQESDYLEFRTGFSF
ncbi:MAG: metallophosphoesterase [Saprospiraceae bacterium]|nr:metallophosphoesterase [Saprospiraceae bacterium]